MTIRRKLTQEEREKVFSLLDEGKKYREVSVMLNVTNSTINNYVSARNAGFKSLTCYRNDLAIKKGYTSHTEYQELFRSRKKKQTKFEDKMPSIDDPKLDWTEPFTEFEPTSDIEDEIRRALFYLANKYPKRYEIIFKRFYGKETLEDIGASLKISRERVRQLESDGIKKMRLFLLKLNDS